MCAKFKLNQPLWLKCGSSSVGYVHDDSMSNRETLLRQEKVVFKNLKFTIWRR